MFDATKMQNFKCEEWKGTLLKVEKNNLSFFKKTMKIVVSLNFKYV